MPVLHQIVLFTDSDGHARFRDEPIPPSERRPAARLSPLLASGGYQLRESPVGFRSEFHCAGAPPWLFLQRGQLEIGLQEGSTRVFGPGQHFCSADALPGRATFDPALHGHRSQQMGPASFGDVVRSQLYVPTKKRAEAHLFFGVNRP